MTHTPGPWTVYKPCAKIGTRGYDKDGKHNYTWWVRPEKPKTGFVIALVECLAMNDKGGNTREDFDRWERKARAAIAKAEGQTHD